MLIDFTEESRPEFKYVINTDKGYIVGNIFSDIISYTDNWTEATIYSEVDLLYNKGAIEERLSEFYDSEFIGFIPV